MSTEADDFRARADALRREAQGYAESATRAAMVALFFAGIAIGMTAGRLVCLLT